MGDLIFFLVIDLMIQNVDYKWFLRTIGMSRFVANLRATTFIRDQNAAIRPSQLAFDVKLLRRYDVILLLSWAFISMLGYMVLLFSLSDFAVSIWLSRPQADQLIAFMNLGTAIGRPWVGLASDRFGTIEVVGGHGERGSLLSGSALRCFGYAACPGAATVLPMDKVYSERGLSSRMRSRYGKCEPAKEIVLARCGLNG